MDNQFVSKPTATGQDFRQLGIDPQILEILTRAGFTKPTPIQAQAIPIGLTGKDLIGIAQTGTGKTLAFGIPLIQRILREQCSALIVVPTRELALQVDESLRRIGQPFRLKTAVLIGGDSMGKQINQINQRPEIILATPGRIIDHLERGSLKLQHISILVLDEADRMLDLGFAKQVHHILESIPPQRQTLLFSATMPADIVKIANRYMHLPLRVEIAPAGTTADRVTQELFFVAKDQKFPLLDRLAHNYEGSILVFCRTKHGAKKLCRTLRDRGLTAAELHSNRSLAQRKQALAGFKDGSYRLLVATDIAARGIDVTGIELVINYDVTENPEDYVHRIGRTGRAGMAGRAITFVQPDQRHKVRDIERLVRATLPVSPLPSNLPQSIQSAQQLQQKAQAMPAHQTQVHQTWGRQSPRQPGQQRHRRRRWYR